MSNKLSAGQLAVLAVVDKHKASGIGTVTRENANRVHARSARSLVNLGILEEFTGADGAMVRRVATSVVTGEQRAIAAAEAEAGVFPLPMAERSSAPAVEVPVAQRNTNPSPPANVEITEFYGTHLGRTISAAVVARALQCAVAEVHAMCGRLVTVGIMRRIGGGYRMWVGPGAGTFVVK